MRGALLAVLAVSLAGATLAFCAGEAAPRQPGRSINYSPPLRPSVEVAAAGD